MQVLPGASPSAPPSTSLGVLAEELASAHGVDGIARTLLGGLTTVPGALRVGLALSEGGGRRLRYTASDRLAAVELAWCHIDAYDDVPLTTVVRSGAPLVGDRVLLDSRFPAFGRRQDSTVQGLAALPLPGVEGPIGGYLMMLDRPWSQLDVWWPLLESVARLAADSIAQVRVGRRPARVEGTAVETLEGARLVVPDDPRSAGVARRFLREVLGRHPEVVADVVDTAELCISELVTNALVHAGGESQLSVVVADGVLTCTVRDHGVASGSADPTGDALADPLADPMRVHGRGLQLIDMLTDRWGSERDAGGWTTWFALAVAG